MLSRVGRIGPARFPCGLVGSIYKVTRRLVCACPNGADVPLLRAAIEAVKVVANKDYRTTHDEQTRQSNAASVIQRAWRQWQHRRQEVEAAALQRSREEAAVRRLQEMSVRLRWASTRKPSHEVQP